MKQKEANDLKYGDKVRLSEYKVQKKTGEYWTKELCRVLKIIRPKKRPYNRIKYKIADLEGEEVQG